MQHDLAAGDRQISDPARIAAVHAVRTPTAARAAGGPCGPMQIDLHGVVNVSDLLDMQAGEMGHGDRDAQGAPPAGSRSPERASLQYYVSWSACTEKEPEPRPEYRTHLLKLPVNRQMDALQSHRRKTRLRRQRWIASSHEA